MPTLLASPGEAMDTAAITGLVCLACSCLIAGVIGYMIGHAQGRRSVMRKAPRGFPVLPLKQNDAPQSESRNVG